MLSHSFENVLDLIINNFDGLFIEKDFYQLEKEKYQYFNKKKNIIFVHDFTEFDTFINQIEKVKEKYERRIRRFYNAITEPTLFLRYIENEKEMCYIVDNYENIQKILQSHCNKNNIVFIANDDLKATYEKYKNKVYPEVYYVEKDQDDNVARRFLEKSEELLLLLNSVYFSNSIKLKNMNFYQSKMKNTTSIGIVKKRIKRKIKLAIGKQYIHNQRISF